MFLINFEIFTEKQFCWSVFFNKVAGWTPETVCSSLWRCSVKKGVLKNVVNFTGKHLPWSLFLINLQALRSATLLKRDSFTDAFLWSLRNFWRHLFLKNNYKRLLLNFIKKETPTQVFPCQFCKFFKNTYFV